MSSASSRGWGSGFPRCQTSKIVTVVRADGLRIPMHRDVAVMTKILMDRTEAMGYNIKPGWTWGFACRRITGSSSPSNHSWGLACDINAPANPYASASWHRRNARGTRPFGLQIVCDIPESVIRMWEGSGWGWGGWYSGHPDPQHFEFNGTPADAARITAALTGGKPPSIVTPPRTTRPPSAGDPPEMNRTEQAQMDRIEAMLTGKVDNSLRHYIRDQDIATRKIIADEHEETRLGTLKVVIKQTATIQEALADLYAKIKKLAG